MIRVLLVIVDLLRRLVLLVWGTLGTLAVVGFFTQAGDGIGKRGVRSLAANALGFIVLFVAPLGTLSLAGHLTQTKR